MYIMRLIVRAVYVARLKREAAVGDVDLEEFEHEAEVEVVD